MLTGRVRVCLHSWSPDGCSVGPQPRPGFPLPFFPRGSWPPLACLGVQTLPLQSRTEELVRESWVLPIREAVTEERRGPSGRPETGVHTEGLALEPPALGIHVQPLGWVSMLGQSLADSAAVGRLPSTQPRSPEPQMWKPGPVLIQLPWARMPEALGRPQPLRHFFRGRCWLGARSLLWGGSHGPRALPA